MGKILGNIWKEEGKMGKILGNIWKEEEKNERNKRRKNGK
jgi:hypothetical protein